MIRNITGSILGMYYNNKEAIRAYLNTVIVYEKRVENRYVTFTANAPSVIGLSQISSNQTLEYSTNRTTWNTMTTSTSISLSTGEEVYIRGILSGDNTTSDYTQFSITGSVSVSGNANTIWNYQNLNDSLKKRCGYRLFYNTNISDAKDLVLPATTLAIGCYHEMFMNSDIIATPELPATTLASSCYLEMFRGCTSLTTAPELLATTVAQNCYYAMFYNCTSLTTAPELPATTLADNCYTSMFYGCTSLTAAPELPATTLAFECYCEMFRGCTSLTVAPELPATTLEALCYYYMFYNCTSLNYVKCLAVTKHFDDTAGWLANVSSTGTFIKAADATWYRDSSGIPSGWTVIETTPLTFTANAPSTIGLNRISTNQSTLQYSLDDGTTWTNMTTSTSINLSTGNKMCIRGKLTGDNSQPNDDYTQFAINGDVSLSGELNTLFNYENLNDTLKLYAAYRLFSYCDGITDATRLNLGSNSLVTGCYWGMFQDCSNLTTAPKLPATSLGQRCYQSMFNGCSSLTTAPDLPATSLVLRCYQSMFANCSSLNSVKCLATSISASNCLNNWLSNVSATGTFTKDYDTNWPSGASGIPSGWTVQNA